MPAIAISRPPLEYKFDAPCSFVFSYPAKRRYGFSDMCQVANLISEVIGGVPPTTVEYWLRKADLPDSNLSPRTSAYTENSIKAFGVYCLCKVVYPNAQRANREYNFLVN